MAYGPMNPPYRFLAIQHAQSLVPGGQSLINVSLLVKNFFCSFARIIVMLATRAACSVMLILVVVVSGGGGSGGGGGK
jgi:hypothetical protein